jgi:hypothetical protein
MNRHPKRPEDLPTLTAALKQSAVSTSEALEIAFLGAPHSKLELLDRLRLRDLARRTARSNPLVFLHLLGVEGRDATRAISHFEERSARWIKALSRKKMKSLVAHLATSIAQSRPVGSPHKRFVTALAFGRHELSCTRANGRWGYRTFYLRKSSGNYRRIDAPSPALKRLLRRTLSATEERVRKRFRWAGVGGCIHSPVEHATRHVGSEVLVSFDIKDFYPSTTRRAVLDGFRCLALAKRGSRLTGYQDELCDALVTALGTRCGILPQGSPTSALLADVAFFPFERRIRAKLSDLESRFGIAIRYSRYADDIVVSYCTPPKRELLKMETAPSRTHGERLRDTRDAIQGQRDDLLAALEQSDEVDAEMILELLAELDSRESQLTREEGRAPRERAGLLAWDATTLGSGEQASTPALPTMTQFRREVERCIEHVLRHSPYRLNGAKTDSGTPDEGFEITGVVLRRGDSQRVEIDLPRSAREQLRGHLHCIETRGLAAAAVRWKAHRSDDHRAPATRSAKRARFKRHAARLCRHYRIATARVAADAPFESASLPTVDPDTGIPFARISTQRLVADMLQSEARSGVDGAANSPFARIVHTLTGRERAELAESPTTLADLAGYLEYLHGMHAHVAHLATHPHASARLMSLAARLAAALGVA